MNSFEVKLVIKTQVEGFDKQDALERVYERIGIGLLKINERNTESITITKKGSEK